MRSRRRVLAVVGAVLLAGCSGPAVKPGSSGGAANASIVYAKTDGGTTFVRNYNVMGPATDKAPNMELVYEPLMRVDYGDGGVLKPWLAASWTFSEQGKQLTIKLRTDVTWSDGQKFSADDVVYSLGLPIEKPDFSIAGVTYKSVAKVDDSTVKVVFAEPSYATLNQFANILLPMVPKHIWSTQNLNTWTNPDPIGTGPFTLKEFKPQQITLQARTDYWGGKLPMSTYKIIPTSADALKAQLLKGDIDWSSASWPNGEKEYVAKDPDKHLYQLYSNGGAMSVLFNTAKAPFDDVHVRRALALTIDRTAVVTTLQRPGTEAGPTGLSDQLFADWLDPAYKGKVQKVDATAAKAELARGGWTIENGALVKDGKRYQPSILFNSDWGWGNYADILLNTWKQTLGLQVKGAGQPSAGYYDKQNLGQFDLAAASTGGSGVYGVYRFLSSSFKVPIGKSATLNQGRWSDPQTDRIIAAMERTDNVGELKGLGRQLQKIVVDDVPFSPIYNNFYFVDINATRWTGWPTPDNFDHIPFVGMGPDTILTMLKLQRRGS
ncbi:ABC transporter substrate-binding protein [Kribbella sp. NBC_00709]|uniref:ABC transporter substrate-binding protein n=1 Tax=Kribbella sp. NBC_00709 TaxID=2975972 RepID=UPI002E2A5CD7|nr:ABC transporter substrate-binding protein [Kribbella sp. NBC_00709]